MKAPPPVADRAVAHATMAAHALYRPCIGCSPSVGGRRVDGVVLLTVPKPQTPGVDPTDDPRAADLTAGHEATRQSQSQRESQSPTQSPTQSPSAHLASSPLFAHVDRQALARFDTSEHWLYLPGGETLFRQGDAADALYIVVRGSLQVIVEEAQGRTRLVDTLGRGALVGEMALLLNDTRTATVVACRDSELVRLGKAEFETLIAEHPIIGIAIARLLGARLKNTTRLANRTSALRAIALLPLNGDAVWHDVGARVAAALSERQQDICYVTPAMVEDLHPGAVDAAPDDAASQRLLHWISGLEDRFRYVVYLADPARPHWTRRCRREADVTLLLAHADTNPELTAIEAESTHADPDRARVELLLLHPAGSPRISGTGRWLEPRRVARHHHVRADVDDDYRRVARFLTGRAVGLVLSGGGARGFAHLGVIQALRAAGQPIDMVGGASMGAIVAALCAAGRDTEAMNAAVRREFAGRQEFDLTLPIVALYTAAASVRKMKRLFGDVYIEDLPIGFFCVSTNLTRAETVVHDRGPVWLWTRASCSIPGLAPPVPYHGDLLVDGGLLNNLPADIMRQRCQGLVVGVDVTAGIDLRTSIDVRPHLSGWPQFWERLSPSRRALAFPNIVDILSRTALVGSMRDAARMRALCDVYLQPSVERFRMGDFHQIDALIEAGAQATRDRLATWPVHD
jgi:predicted acylesterase/phospholipase RssA/CRP-like cAMP-binding protein